MYLDTSTLKKNGKVFTRHLLRTSFREDGKVKHTTIANVSACSANEVAAIRLALKHKNNLAAVASIADVQIVLGKRIGAAWVVHVLAERVGIAQALGTDREGKVALLQVLARVLDQGSRLSAVRLAQRHALCELLGIQKLDEDDLYANLGWLSTQQEAIEQRLFAGRFPETVPTLFLYDVTSAYLEGRCNALAEWGYDRDKKRGKKQIVVGLLTGPDGLPVAVRVFKGNTNDPKTVSDQVQILAERFGVTEVTLVGDRGMLKGPQIALLPEGFRYITAITKPQIVKMLHDGVLQYTLFDAQVCEVELQGIRYLLRRNPVRAEQLAAVREAKEGSLRALAADRTRYLADHPKADVGTAGAKVRAKITKLHAQHWLSVTTEGRSITVERDAAARAEAAVLDGCYVIKSDVPKPHADAQTLHDRYCDLERVERSFRTMKTAHLEMRPVFVRKEDHTRGHVFVVMLALLVQRALESSWGTLDVTVQEGIDELAAICMQEVQVGTARLQNIPTPTLLGTQLLAQAGVVLPAVLPAFKASVHTKKKLQNERR
jgi:hypothetical protein